MKNGMLLFLFALLSCVVIAQPRTMVAVKATQAIRIDASLDEAIWQQAPVANDFIQLTPNYGQPSVVKSEVRILYDNDAVYIGAYLFDEPSEIRKQLTSRDGEQQQDVDHFSVFFDTYNDLQNGFQFLVTSANVQTDSRLSGGGNYGYGSPGDKTWDAVWESKTAITDKGWIAEMRIPYISLRFSKKDVQTWGLQFARSVRRFNETSFWNPVSPQVNGFVNQFGKLTDIRDIDPPLRLSFSPYLSGGVRFNPPGNYQGREWLGSGGMDVKYGLNESFTLDATLIPDFGQVVSDNVVNNLSPFEQRFQENRPFFTEGTELFNKSGLFYSRRVGARPSGYFRVDNLYGYSPDYEIKKNPSLTRLYNAIKFSGRTEGKLGIGVFNAVTAPMEARVRDLNLSKDTVIRTEPMANYNIIVLDKAFKGRSSVTFTNTNVIKSGAARDANVTSLDWALYNNLNSHSISGTVRYSKIFGYTPYNGSYFMNTDTISMNGVRYLKPYDGYNARLRLAKVSGKIQYLGQVNVESSKYDPNDLGYLDAANEITYTGSVVYNQFTPKGKFLSYNYGLNVIHRNLYDPYKFSSIDITAQAFWFFRNFWDIRLSVGSQPVRTTDYFELQTFGYRLKKPINHYINAEGSTDSRKALFVNYEFAVSKAAKDQHSYLTLLGARYRFSDKLTMGISGERQHEEVQIGYAFERETDGSPIVGYRDFKTLTTVVTGVYNFTPRMNITIRSRHYWNKVHYLGFYNVDAAGEHIPRSFINNKDENVNIFNVDAFFTWDFKLGSRVIFGWKNWLGDEWGVDGLQYKDYGNNFRKTFDIPHGNELTLRLIYFLDYNQIKKKK